MEYSRGQDMPSEAETLGAKSEWQQFPWWVTEHDIREYWLNFILQDLHIVMLKLAHDVICAIAEFGTRDQAYSVLMAQYAACYMYNIVYYNKKELGLREQYW